jgi:hypothetical protein
MEIAAANGAKTALIREDYTDYCKAQLVARRAMKAVIPIETKLPRRTS